MNIYLIVFIVYFGIIIATSIMGSKKVESMEDFAVGGNKMGLLLGDVYKRQRQRSAV